jgi:hypothetical protein
MNHRKRFIRTPKKACPLAKQHKPNGEEDEVEA